MTFTQFSLMIFLCSIISEYYINLKLERNFVSVIFIIENVCIKLTASAFNHVNLKDITDFLNLQLWMLFYHSPLSIISCELKL